MSDAPAVEVSELTRRFGTLTAVDGVSFRVQRGHVLALLGHNGAGKTTLIRLVTGLLHADEGWISAFGMDPIRDGRRIRERTGVLTEYPALDHFLSPTENLRVHAEIHGLDRATASQRIDDLIDQLELADHRHLPARSLSAGLKQRVALARALLHDPDLLLLDEPTSNLDPLGARTVRGLVHRLARERGRTVILSTHNLAEAQELADVVAVIRHGQLLAFGGLDELAGSFTTTRTKVTVARGTAAGATAVLRREDFVHDAEAIDDATLSVRVAAHCVPALVRCLVEAHTEVFSVLPERPTLEEVYVALHSRARSSVATGVGP